jgi:L-iditol 2-dehydrogenase
VAVIGAGPLGLAHAIKASLMGAGHLYVIDPSARRRNLAARLADAVALAPGEPIEREIDLVVNATGFPGTFAQAEGRVRDGGTIVEVGAFVDMGGEAFNPASICGRSLAVLGVGGEDLTAYEGTLALLDRHRHAIALDEMVSHRFEIAQAPAAMAVALDAEASAKVLITPGS